MRKRAASLNVSSDSDSPKSDRAIQNSKKNKTGSAPTSPLVVSREKAPPNSVKPIQNTKNNKTGSSPKKHSDQYRGLNVEENSWIISIWNNNFYSSENLGPFFVHLYDVRENHALGNFHRMSLGKLCMDNDIVVKKILKAGSEKLILIFESGEQANKFVREDVYRLNPLWFALIPDQGVFSCKLIHDVPLEFTKADILNGLDVEVRKKIRSIERCRQRSNNNDNSDETEWNDSMDIKLFCTGDVPKEIDLFFCPVKVLNYSFPVKRCFSCQRYGHIEGDCKFEPRCCNCGNSHSGDCIFEDVGLDILNSGKITRIVPGSSRKSVPDMTVSSPDISNALEWDVMQDALGSDHLPMLVKFHRIIPNAHQSRPVWSTNKVDWQGLGRLFNENFKEKDYMIDSINYLDMYDKFEAFVHSCLMDCNAKLNSGSRGSVASSNNAPWWNKECGDAVEERREAQKLYLNDCSLLNWVSFCKSKSKARKAIEKAKKSGFKEFCNNLSPDIPMGVVWKKINCYKKRFANPLPESKDSHLSVDDPKLKKAIEKISGCYPRSSVPSVLSNCTNPPGSCLGDPISFLEVSNAISKSKIKSAPGPDNISYKMIKRFSTEMIEWLKTFFERVLLMGSIPEVWKKFLVCFIPKPNNSGFRPIALSCAILKILERVLNDRIMWFLENRVVFPDSFHGFRIGKSCNNCLTGLKLNIDLARLQGKHLGAVFLDLEGAYDSVNLDKLEGIMLETGLSSRIVNFITQAFGNRRVEAFCGGSFLKTFVTNKGLPQGSILSPILFNLYISKVNSNLSVLTRNLSFADDLTFFVSATTIHDITKILSEDLVKLKSFFQSLDLTISIPKTKFMLFPKKNVKVPVNSVSLVFDGDSIYNVSAVRYLGVLWNVKMDWKSHLDYIKDKSSKLINMLRCISSFSWGSHPETMLIFYKSYIRPSLEWGYSVFADAKKNLLYNLEVIQNNALRISSGSFRTTPINSLLHLNGIVPLAVRRGALMKKFLVKVHRIGNDEVFSYINIIDSMLEGGERDLNSASPFVLRCWRSIKNYQNMVKSDDKLVTFNIPYKSHFLSEYCSLDRGRSLQKAVDSEISFCNIIQEDFRDFKVIFTDGSKDSSKEEAGFGIWSKDLSIRKGHRVNEKFSIFAIEAIAILESLRMISSREESSKFLICSDSLSVISNIEKDGIDGNMHHIIGNIRRILWSLNNSGQNCVLMWIPGHKGIRGNEKADNLAAEGRSADRSFRVCLDASDIFPIIKKDMLDITYKEMESYGDEGYRKGRLYFNNAPRFNLIPWFSGSGLSRRQIIVANRIMTSHTRLNGHLFRMKMALYKNCECGLGEESLNHVIWDCPFWEGLVREQLVFFLNGKGVNRHDDISICFITTPQIRKRIIDFILVSKIVL